MKPSAPQSCNPKSMDSARLVNNGPKKSEPSEAVRERGGSRLGESAGAGVAVGSGAMWSLAIGGGVESVSAALLGRALSSDMGQTSLGCGVEPRSIKVLDCTLIELKLLASVMDTVERERQHKGEVDFVNSQKFSEETSREGLEMEVAFVGYESQLGPYREAGDVGLNRILSSAGHLD